MSYAPFTALCTMRELNDGIVRALFTADAHTANPATHPEYVLVNLDKTRGPYEEDKLYWISIYPAHPR